MTDSLRYLSQKVLSILTMKGIKEMSKSKKSGKSLSGGRKVFTMANPAAADVAELLKLVTNGPRFQGHVSRIATQYELTNEERSLLVKRAFRKFLGY